VCLFALYRSVESDLPLIPERQLRRLRIERDRRDRLAFGRILRNLVRRENPAEAMFWTSARSSRTCVRLLDEFAAAANV